MTDYKNSRYYGRQGNLGKLSGPGFDNGRKRLTPLVVLPENGSRLQKEEERVKIIIHLLRGGTLTERPFERLFEHEREIVRAQAVAFLFWRQSRAELRF